MKVEGKEMGHNLLREGYTTDSYGDPIEWDRLYSYEAERYVGIDLLWPAFKKRPNDLGGQDRTMEQDA